MRDRLLGLLIVVLLLSGTAFSWAAEAASRPPTPLPNVPRAEEPDNDPVWDTLAGLETAGKWAASESLATALVERLEASPEPDSLKISHALFFVANGLIKQRIYADGRGFGALERAIGIRRRILGPEDRGAIWGHVLASTFYTEAGHPDLAADHGRAALDQLDPANPEDFQLLGQAHLGSATALTALRRYDEARVEYREALRIRETVLGPENRNLVPMLAEYGAFLGRIGEFDEARALLKRAVHIAELDLAAGNSADFLDGSLSRLSTLENRTGNIGESLELAQRAYGLSQARLGDTAIPTVRLKTIVSYRLLDLGDFAGAALLLREIVPAMENGLGMDHPQTVNARLSLLEALVEIGDTTRAQTALEASRRSMSAQDPLANSNWTYFLQLVARFEQSRGNTQAARDTLATAVHIEDGKHDPVGEQMGLLLADYLDTARDPGDRPLVEALRNRVGDLADSTGVRATPSWPHLLASLAVAEAKAGMSEAAWEHALEAERLGRERLGYELQALPDTRALTLAGTLGEPCELVLGLLPPGRSREVSTAWDRLVEWRGRVRHEIARRRAPVAGDAETNAAHAAWIAAQRKLGQLVVSGFAGPDDPDTADRFEAARSQAEEAERRYVRRVSGLLGPATDVHLEPVLAGLHPGEGLAAFAVGDPGAGEKILGVFLFAGAGDEPEWVNLGPVEEIETKVRAWTDALGTPPAAGHEAEEESAARDLGLPVRAALWEPIASSLGPVDRVILVPEGPAADVPWLAIPEPDGKYLADTGPVIRILDAERDLLSGPARRNAEGLLAVGGPDFDRPGEEQGTAEFVALAHPTRAWRCSDGETLALPPLPHSAAEVKDIARQWSEGPARVLVGSEAEESAFKREASGHAVVHLATHGVLVDESCAATSPVGTRGIGGMEPLGGSSSPGAGKRQEPAPSTRPWFGVQVWLALAGANSPPSESRDENEGLLTAEEIVTLDLRGTDWVVLSACHSALARSFAREGLLGMQRAFRMAGARAVIASRWSVGDASAREWMGALYSARKPGRSAGEAVGEACRTVLLDRRRRGQSTHPFYWAAFTASGD